MKALTLLGIIMVALSGAMFRAIQPIEVKTPHLQVQLAENRASRRAKKKKGKKKFGY